MARVGLWLFVLIAALVWQLRPLSKVSFDAAFDPTLVVGGPVTLPPQFFWGTSTAAAQIETASNHTWRGLVALDGEVFERTADHEKRRAEDASLIKKLGGFYRFSVDWARLQKSPFAPFDKTVVEEYRVFLKDLKASNVQLMFVLHHFTEPTWFVGWHAWSDAVPQFLDFAKKAVEAFGDLADSFNTFNEPNVYLLSGYLLGNFPPFLKGSIWKFHVALFNMAEAHASAVKIIRKQFPFKRIGISLNTCLFVGSDWPGTVIATIFDYIFHRYIGDRFRLGTDFLGISYYAKIRMSMSGALTEIDKPGVMDSMGIPHDGMWEYEPRGMLYNMERLYDGRPIIVTEFGISTTKCEQRINAINDYVSIFAAAINRGIPVLGAFHWSTIDNFEWNLGVKQRFGLVHVDRKTMERTMKESGRYWMRVIEKRGTK